VFDLPAAQQFENFSSRIPGHPRHRIATLPTTLRDTPKSSCCLVAASRLRVGSWLLLSCWIQPLRPLLTSPRSSATVAGALLRIVRRNEGISRVRCRCFLRALPNLSARVSGWSIGRPRLPAGCPHRAGLLSGSCSSGPNFASGLLSTPPRGDAVAFGLRFPPPGPQRACTSSVGTMPGTQRKSRPKAAPPRSY